MKLSEEFQVDEPVGTVWKFFEQPELVARCVPGVESITVVDSDNVNVRATQSIGPLTATFDAKITVLERVPHELIRFSATGRSVRGASGNIRTSNAVHLRADGAGTIVMVDGDVILAGALGSVGQKIVAKQAGKVTAEFARNLQHVLSGQTLQPAGRGGVSADADMPTRPDAGSVRSRIGLGPTPGGRPPDPWSRAAAALSAASCLLSLIVLLRNRRRPR